MFKRRIAILIALVALIVFPGTLAANDEEKHHLVLGKGTLRTGCRKLTAVVMSGVTIFKRKTSRPSQNWVSIMCAYP